VQEYGEKRGLTWKRGGTFIYIEKVPKTISKTFSGTRGRGEEFWYRGRGALIHLIGRGCPTKAKEGERIQGGIEKNCEVF